jgi:lipopolysaccharide biosynthesis glycosyltransferase
MEVLCACDKRYVPHTATMLCSLINHNNGCRIHILHCDDAREALLKLRTFVEGMGSQAVLYQIRPEDLSDVRVDKWFSIAAYYRLVGPRVLPTSLSKILYLDSDVVVLRSLGDLWNTDLYDHALAAVEDIDARPVAFKNFNSGVMLMNLEFWRQNDVGERAIAFARNHPEKIEYHDQDALNAILAGKWVELPAIWNDQINHFDIGMVPLADVAIMHCAGAIKPWHWSWNLSVPHPLKSEYHRYRRQTPWPLSLREGRVIVPWQLSGYLRAGARALLPWRAFRAAAGDGILWGGKCP